MLKQYTVYYGNYTVNYNASILHLYSVGYSMQIDLAHCN